MADALRVAVVQMSSQDDVARNLARAAELAKGAVVEGAKLVVLPENFAYMGTEDGKRAVAERLDADGRGPIATALADIAQSSGAYVVAGGMPERSSDPDRPFNTCAVIGPDGALIGRYRKVHLFDVEVGDGQRYCESASTTAGGEPVAVSILGFNVGLSVC
jgi:predicted amidohydrolase